ncbi:Hypothetical predicted protein [Cloeon dipterum]|uniref:Protein krueppel n=1 Tax=Cloeon dipterum TaxID=197152 RepID=A0A8S1DHU0_9INSE|nr:Hypothetical predicted protein [Cloeon dipterum]
MTSSVTDLCRLCGTDTFNIVRHHIFEAESLAKCIAKKIAECLPVNVTPQDRLPKHMCGECAYKLDLLSEFRDKAVKTEHLLESLVDGVKPEILENEEPDNDLGADDGFRSDSPDQPEPEVLIKEEDAEPRPERRPVRKAARKVGRPRGRKRKQTEIEPDTEEEVESEEAPKKAVKKEEAPPKVYRKRGRKPKNNKESPGWERPFVCHMCGRSYRSSSHLSGHFKVHLPPEFKCEFCGKQFVYKRHLGQHVERHLGVTHQCEVCGTHFSQSNSLSTHMRTLHSQIEKPLACVVCLKRFGRGEDLKRHMRIHTNEKPYACNLCQWKFTQSSQLRTHKMGKHGIMPHICDLCGQGFRNKPLFRHHCKEAHHKYI